MMNKALKQEWVKSLQLNIVACKCIIENHEAMIKYFGGKP